MSHLTVVEVEIHEIDARIDLHTTTADRAMDELRQVGSQARSLARELKNLRRRLSRNTRRLCNALDLIGVARPGDFAPRRGTPVPTRRGK